MKKLNLFVVACSILSLAPCFSQSQAPAAPQSELLTIDQAVAEALEKNLGLLAERYNLTIADARIVTARLRPNPVLSLDADTLDLLGTAFNPQTNAGGPSSYSIRSDFLLERGGKRQARIAVAEGNRAVAQLQLLNAVRGIVLDVQNAFVDLQSAKDSLRLAQENLQTLHDIVDINEKRVKNGDLAEVELLRAQVAELQFENSVRQAELRVKTAKAKLQILLGRIRNARPFDIVGELRRDPTVPGQEALLKQARQMRPDLLALVRDQARSQAEIRNQLALGKVDYTIGSEYLRQADTAHTNTLGFFFQTNIPIFNRNQGEIERARQEQRQIEARIRAIQATVENDVEIAYQQYATAGATLEKVERAMVGKARDVRSITEYSYKRGEATFVEFLDAQRAQVPLSQLADVRVVTGASIIARRDNQRAMTIRTNIVNPDQGGFVDEAQQRLERELHLPPGYQVVWGGQFENLERARRRLYLIIPVTIAIIFSLLFFAFGSTSSAMLVLLNVPFSVVGGVTLLYLRNIHLSVSAAVGFISLFGVAVMSGVLFISEINRRRKEGDMTLEDAVVLGAKYQLRPRLILILVAMFGMVPAASAAGIGSDVQRPLATVVVGGLLSTLLLTLLALPSLYYLVERRKAAR